MTARLVLCAPRTRDFPVQAAIFAGARIRAERAWPEFSNYVADRVPE